MPNVAMGKVFIFQDNISYIQKLAGQFLQNIGQEQIFLEIFES